MATMSRRSSEGSIENQARDLVDVPPLFTELLDLQKYDDGCLEWKEVARWIKFEETVESEGNRWSKPHVSTPSLAGWMQLRKFFRSGLILLDVEARDMGKICDIVAAALASTSEGTDPETVARMKDLWMLKHRHQHEGPRKVGDGKLTTVIKDLLVQKLESKTSGLRVPGTGGGDSSSRRASMYIDGTGNEMALQRRGAEEGKVNLYLQKKLDSNTEAAVILEGTVGFLEVPISVFIRLSRPAILGDLPEVDIPTRFLYLVATPPQDDGSDRPAYCDVGVSLATAIANKKFAKAIYNAEKGEEIVDALDAYTNELSILPGDFDTELNNIDPPSNKANKKMGEETEEDIDEDRRMREQSGLVRTGRVFGGLMADLKRKRPFYLSDFTQGIHTQCISSFLFLYFACLAPIVAFGGLLGEATGNQIATIESLISGLISGVVFGLFAGQPLTILGSTGPVYVFEKILYQICEDQGWDYLSLRLWIGLWVGAILLLLVALDAAAYVCYITRFTEELFAVLIAFIFIFNAVQNLFKVAVEEQFVPKTTLGEIGCSCKHLTTEFENMTKEDCLNNNGTLVGDDCDYHPNVFLMSVILFLGAFTISYSLKNFRNTGYLPGKVRNLLSDFAVPIAILSMTLMSYVSKVDTPKLIVPNSFQPTSGRSWMVVHALVVAEHALINPWWVDVFLAPVLAILATILIFMDQQITAVIVNRKEHKLKKGGGYHLDLLVLAIIIIVKSVFGLPWFVAATVLSINHIQSLTKESESSAPGEKPHFLGIREQRVTPVLIGLAIGLSTLITPILGLIPKPVLFGVFLFMGVQSLKGLQFFERILLLFIPHKHQPDYVFLKYVPLMRVHMFTLIQLLSLVGQVMLVLICAIRKLMECLFTRRELRVLDDLLPENSDKSRRKGGRSDLFRRLNWVSDDYEAEKAKEEAKRKEMEEQEAGFRRTRAMTNELVDLGKVDMRAKSKALANLVRRRRTGSFAETKEISPPQYFQPKFLIFVKLETQKVFTPMHLTTKTVRGLLRKLEAKFPGEVKSSRVSCVYQRTRKNLTFYLDDDMMEFLTPNEVFNVEVSPVENSSEEKIELTLAEVDDA